MQTTDSIDLDSYFKFIGLDEYNTKRPEPNLPTLTKIVEKHATSFFYQNVDLQIKYVRGQPIVKEDLLLSFIQNKLIDRKRGGMCYEINFLIEAVLVALGFKVQFASAFNAPYLPERETSHMVLIVKIDSDYYIVDPGFGVNNVRVPLKFDFETSQETTGLSFEKYQIVIEPNYYQANLTIDDKMLPLFYFMKEGSGPKISDKEKLISEYISFMNSPQEFRVRDWCLYLGGATPDGRFGYWWDKKEKAGFTFKQANNLSAKEKIDFKNFEEFQTAAKETFGIEVPTELQKISVRPSICERVN